MSTPSASHSNANAAVNNEAWVTDGLRALGYALTGALFCIPLGVTEAVITAALGAAAGALGARWLSRTAWHLWVWVVVLGLSGATLVWIHEQAIAHVHLSQALEPAQFMRWSQALLYGLLASLAALVLRLSSIRHPFCAAFEVVLVALSFAQLVVGHREGAINRPFEIADPIIASGGDPTYVFYAVGAAAVVVILWLLLRERSGFRALWHLLFAMLLLGIVLSSVRFVGSPQPADDALGLRGDPEKRSKGDRKGGQQEGNRGANDELEFRDDYDAPGNQAPVAVVLMHNDFSPPTGLYYFRQGAFSQYNGQRLVRAMRSDVDQDVISFFPTEPTEVAAVPGARGQRATVDTTVALLADHKQPFGLEAPSLLQPAPNPTPDRFKRVFRVTSEALSSDFYALLGARAGAATWSEEQRTHYTESPRDPRYRTLATEIVETLPEALRHDPAARAMAIAAWLSREGVYSLRSKHAGAEDPTAHFLFGDRTGYCVHFAHAAVYLMRALDLPARVGTGYVFEESARQGGSAILLSGQNAHAWPEIYLEGIGWVIADVSPENALDPAMPPPDADLQRLLGELARGEELLPRDGSRPLQPLLAAVRVAVEQVVLFVAWLIVGLCLALYAVKLWRRGAPLWARETAAARVTYRAELDRLAEARLRRHPGESRERFAARIAAQCPSFASLTRAHVARVFSAQPASSSEAVRDVARQVQRELRLAVPWWRRTLGALIPWSWMSSR